MELINGTKFDLNTTQASDKHGQPWLVVVAKATYAIPEAPDIRTQLAETQRGLLVKDVFEGQEGLSTPLLENDFAPTKPVCDVVVIGSAHAPRGEPITETSVGITIGPIKKVVRVVGDRRWVKGQTGYEPSKPEPFLTMPITYARAFGGQFAHQDIGSDDPRDFLVHPANLVGCGYARDQFLKLIQDRPVPNLEAPGSPIRSPEHLYTPVSLGPVSRNWTPRLTFAGTYDQHWQDEIFPLLPTDFDERFYQCAPIDQQMPYPRGGEEISLLNLCPGRELTRFRLPDLKLPMVVLFKRRESVALTPVVDTLVIDCDAMTFDVVWRARTRLQRSMHEINTVAAGNVCKRWWMSRVYGTNDCGCSGLELNDEDLTPVTEALD